MPPNGTANDANSAPLADYFWIAGVDSLSYGQHFRLNPDTGEKEVNGIAAAAAAAASRPLDSPIDEDRALETPAARGSMILQESCGADGPTSETADVNVRLSKLSNESRLSMYGNSADQPGYTASNRSSATIRAVPPQISINGLSDDDFDRALRKFTVERDSFLDELSVSAGAVPPATSHIHPRASRLNEDTDRPPLRSNTGSVRRHFSLRDLNSMKRQPSMARTGV